MLSTTENPSQKTTIISIEQKHRTAIDEWNTYPAQRSCPQKLQGHVVYYLEGLHSNYIERDHMRVRVTFPDSKELRVLDKQLLLRYSPALDCQSLRQHCGVLCGGGGYTELQSVDPVTKTCTIYKPSTIKGLWHPTTRKIVSPLKVTAQPRSSTTILVQWQFDKSFTPKGITGYRLSYTHKKPRSEGMTDKLITYDTILGPSSMTTELKGLMKFTSYCIKVAFITDEESEPGACTFAKTLEDVPSIPPKLHQVVNNELKSIRVAWQSIPYEHTNGIVLGYRINLTNLNTTDTEPEVVETGSDALSIVISGLEKFTRYCARVLAFTRTGDGPASDCVEVHTWTDDVLPKMKIINRTSPFALCITWEALPSYLAGHLIGYMVSYTPISEAGIKLQHAQPQMRNVTANITDYHLTGLSTFTTYKVNVRPLTSYGVGYTFQSAYGETCRCPQQMTASWYLVPPYTETTGSPTPGGIVPEILQDMLRHACGTCLEFNKTRITYTPEISRTKRSTDVKHEVDFVFPLRRSRDIRKESNSSGYVSLLEVPGFAFLTGAKTKVYARQVAKSVFQCWPIMAMSLAMTLVAGCLIWFIETVYNPQQFRRRFYLGIIEGVWWSFISMTTVGYGDKVPSTKLGRAFAIVWFLIGVVVVAILVGSITSSLSAKILNDRINVHRDKRMASLDNPLDYKALLRVGKQATERETYSDIESLVGALKIGRAEGIVVDMYMAGFRTDLLDGTWYTVSSILDQKFSYGVEIGGNASKLARLFREYAGKGQEVRISLLKKARSDVKVEAQFTAHSKARLRTPDFLDPRTWIFKITIFIILAALCACVLVGMLFHSWRRNKEHEANIRDQPQNSTEKYLTTKQEMKDLLEDFHKRIYRTYFRLKLKHRQEIKELSKLKKYAKRQGPRTIWL